MNNHKLSNRIYFGLIILLALLSALNPFLPQGDFISGGRELPASKPVIAMVSGLIMLLFYGGLGFLGLSLSRKLGYPDLIESGISHKQRFLTPAITGVVIGVVFILADLMFASGSKTGPLPHPPFPTSLVASVTAGIGEEIIFRLFFISFWVWLISQVILEKKYKNTIFWVFAFLSAIAFTAGHLPSTMIWLGLDQITNIPIAIVIELFLLNGLLSIIAAYHLRQFGFLAAVSVHLWTDIVWHVLWGAL